MISKYICIRLALIILNIYNMNTTTIQKYLFYYRRSLTIPVVGLLSIYNNIFQIILTLNIYNVKMIKRYIISLYSIIRFYIKKGIIIRIIGI